MKEYLLRMSKWCFVFAAFAGVVACSDDDAEGVTLSLQVTIFSNEDEVELAREIKSIMKENGFSFEGRNGDDSKPEDGIYMKAQRFTKYYESEEKS